MGSKRSALLCALLTLTATPPAMAQQDAWAFEAYGPYSVLGASATDGTYFYITRQAFESVPGGNYYGQLSRYDPANNSWTTLANMPYAIRANAGAYHNGRLFSFGGQYFYLSNGNWTVANSNMIHAYTISTNSWTTLSATLNANRSWLDAAATPTPLGVRIYVTGGFIDGGWGGSSSANDEFDPSTDTVTARAAMPAAINSHAMAAVPSISKVYVMTGSTSSGQSALNWEYTPPATAGSGGSWTVRASLQSSSEMPQRYGAAAFSMYNRVFVTGGSAGGVVSPATYEYHPNTDTWVQRDSMAEFRYFHDVVGPIGGKGYVLGYGYSYNGLGVLEEYTPLDYGSNPNPASAVRQEGSRPETSLQAQTDSSQPGGWTNSQITFAATLTDPDPGQQVRFRVQIKRVGEATWTDLDSGFIDQGTVALPFAIPAPGDYDWRWRVEDTHGNSHPSGLDDYETSWVAAFGNSASPDFRSDQSPPSVPSPASPDGIDLESPDPAGAAATLSWIPSTDDGPPAGLVYEIQIASDNQFAGLEAQVFASAVSNSLQIFLTPSRFDKHWRLRATDIGNNTSEWSAALSFRLVHDDGGGHDKTCSYSAAASATRLPAPAVLGMAILAFAIRRAIGWSPRRAACPACRRASLPRPCG